MSDMTAAQTKAQCQANVAFTKAQAIRQLVDAGYDRDLVARAVAADNFDLLVASTKAP